MSANCVTAARQMDQISAPSSVTRFKGRVKARGPALLFFQTPPLFVPSHLPTLARAHPPVHRAGRPASQPSIIAIAVAWCSLDACRLMDESPLSSSVKAPLYQACSRAGTSHLIRSQWKPVALRHHSYWVGGGGGVWWGGSCRSGEP